MVRASGIEKGDRSRQCGLAMHLALASLEWNVVPWARSSSPVLTLPNTTVNDNTTVH